MPQEKFEIVRLPIAVKAHSRRRLEERLALHFPGALAFFARAVWRLPVRSRLRQALLCRAMRLALEATNRGDYEAVFGALYDPDCELISPPDFLTVGAADSMVRGREARTRWQRDWHADWGGFRYEPEELIDLGDRLLVVGRVKGRGLSSGAAFDREWANLITVSAGRVTREEPFLSHREALEAAGVSE